MLPLCRELEVAYVPYFPLASGLLTGKYRRGEPAPEGTRLAGREIDDERLARVERMTRFAEERGHTHPRARDLGARLDSGNELGHRGRDEARAGAGERRGGRLAAE